MSGLTLMKEWLFLEEHSQQSALLRMDALFTADSARQRNQTKMLNTVEINFSHNRCTQAILDGLYDLALKNQVKPFIGHLFSNQPVNITEGRAALHAALRSPHLFADKPACAQIIDNVSQVLSQIKTISEDIRSGFFNGRRIKHVVNFGIGGSDLGPRMVVNALAPYVTDAVSIDFVSNLDPWHLHEVLARLDKENTLLIFSSKSFTTYETLTNIEQAIEWLGGRHKISQCCLAITANHQAALAFGIAESHILPVWDWVGGRYSVWSAVGLPVAIAIGFERFSEFLQGASVVDEHVYYTDMRDNIALRLALLDCWNINFSGALTRAVVPYSQKLTYFTDYIQQLVMESNGKSTDIDGNKIDYHTGPVILGGIGSDSQHAFHQMIMQGTQLIPVDFIAIRYADSNLDQAQQDRLNSQLKGQSAALYQGNMAQQSDNHRVVNGNIPHNIFTLERLTPSALGTLIALYEYRTILNACLWRINPFDQFGVELGKSYVLQELELELETE